MEARVQLASPLHGNQRKAREDIAFLSMPER
jgi:hypothetical protein